MVEAGLVFRTAELGRIEKQRGGRGDCPTRENTCSGEKNLPHTDFLVQLDDTVDIIIDGERMTDHPGQGFLLVMEISGERAHPCPPQRTALVVQEWG